MIITANKINFFPYDYEISLAKALLVDGEVELPDNIKSVVKFCCDRGMGFVLSRNTKAMSCRDARSKRSRLGHIGIPLDEELKSIVFKGFDANSSEKIIMAHCRGHREIDESAIKKICNLKHLPEKMCESEMLERFGMVFGIVNPFLAESRYEGKFVHVFDKDILRIMKKIPGTMMTNAGDHTWGIEFDPSLMVSSIGTSMIDNIAKITEIEVTKADLGFLNFNIGETKHIGIITGNGPDSGITLWSRINREIVEFYGNSFSGDISFPKVTVVSLPTMGLSMELDKREDAVWAALSEAIQQLQTLDVDLLAIACHTTHYFTDKIRSLFDVDGKKFVSMAEATIDYVREKQIKDIAILGINFVADLEFYSAYRDLRKMNVENVSRETLNKFHTLGYEVKQMQNNYAAFQKFISLLKKEIKSQYVVIALTELSILWQSRKKSWETSREIIDPIDIYAKKIVAEYKGEF